MRRVVSTALLLAAAVTATSFVIPVHIYRTSNFPGTRPADEEMRCVIRDPLVAYCVPFVDMWWNINALFRSNRVPLFTAQRFRDRLSARQLALAPASTGAGARRIFGIFLGATTAVGETHTLPGMCKGADSFCNFIDILSRSG